MKIDYALTKKIVLSFLLSIVLLLFFCAYDKVVAASQLSAAVEAFQIAHIGLFLAAVLVMTVFFTFLFWDRKKTLQWLFRYRFVIALACFIVCVLFGITGSSIGCMANSFGGEDNGVLLGVSRGIRSDEWAVSTPMLWSQYKDPQGSFSYYSSVLRGGSTDVFLEYGQPVKNILMLYRPFYLGYLFLPIAQGMAFFWFGRWIALFLISFEFGRLLTKDKRGLSLVYAFAILFAPVTQWWFAINGFVEMLMYLQLSIIALHYFLIHNNFRERIIWIAVIVICAGGYVLTFYPAWMIPLAYILLALIVWQIVEHRKECKVSRRDWVACIGGAVIFLLSMAYLYHMSGDTIQALMNTAYPGSRVETGGGVVTYMCSSASNIWYAMTGNGLVANTCESAYFIDLFPICYILPIVYRMKIQKKDFLTACLTVPIVFLAFYCIFGVPKVVAEVTLIGRSTANRALIGLGFANLLLLFRTIAEFEAYELKISIWKTAILAFVAAFAVVWINVMLNFTFYMYLTLCITILVFAVLYFACMNYHRKIIKTVFCFVMAGTVFVSGCLVNPVRMGVKSVQKLPILNEIEEIVAKDPTALWITEGAGLPMINLGIMAGASTITSTNIYPNLETWRKIDTTGEQENIYNRYAHITMNLVSEEMQEPFQESFAPDCFIVNLTVDQLRQLNVTYMLSVNEFENDELELISQIDDCFIYKVLP